MLKKLILFAALIVLIPLTGIFAHTGYYYYPDINGNEVIFSSRGSVWKVETQGGDAEIVTSMKSNYVSAKLSPDSRHIAYSISIDGNIDIYLMNKGGGIPKRLTYHPSRDNVLGFTPEGDYVVFSSSRSHPHRRPNIWKVSINGGMPEMIEIGKADLISFDSSGDFIAFNRNASPHATWKRYKGGRMSEIWAGSLSKMDFTQITDFEGSNKFPMIYGKRIYFLSDRKGRNNLFSMDYDGGNIKQHTFYEDFDINYPSLGGGSIVFQKGGDIFKYIIEDDNSVKLEINLPVDNLTSRTIYENAADWINSFELSAEAQRVLLDIRGNIYLAPVREGRVVSVACSPGIRFKNPAMNSDGSKIAYFSDESGTEQLYISKAEDNAERVQLTDKLDGWYNRICWSPDDERIAFSDEKLALHIYDFKTKKTVLIDRSEWSEIDDYSWSPCGMFLSYAKRVDNNLSNIYIYDIEEGKSHLITKSIADDRNPVWGPEGQYLYFLSETQFSPLMDHIDHEAIITKLVRPHIVLLTSEVKNPLLPRDWQELANLDKPGKEESSKEDSEKPEKIRTRIEYEGIEKRIFPLPVRSGNYHRLSAVKDKVYFMDRKDRRWMADRQYYDNEYFKRTLYSYNIKERKFEEVLDGIDAYSISVKKDKILYLKGSSLRLGEDIINLNDINLAVMPSMEWEQIFNEAVRLQRLLYWAPNIGNIDWYKYAERYRKALFRIGTRSELNMLIGELIGELATSHTYIFTGGSDFSEDSINIGLLGADIVAENDRFRIKNIYEGDAFYANVWSPLSIHPIKAGDYIISVNGISLSTENNFYSYFENLADREIIIGISHDAYSGKVEDYRVRPVSSEYYLRYYDWVYGNREYVDEKSGGRIGYVHIPDMSGFGLVEFFKQYFNQINKDAIIIDDRYNGGGNVSQIILEKLRRELSYLSVSRYTSPRTSPRNVFLGHLACLINEDAGSDGDLFPEAFRMYGLGKLIGTKTWGGVVGIRSDKPFVDGGMMTIPEFCNYHIDRGWILENEGVVPDIEVAELPQDYSRKIDRQLDKAIDVLAGELAAEPVEKPHKFPYPDNTIDAWIKFWEDKNQ